MANRRNSAHSRTTLDQGVRARLARVPRTRLAAILVVAGLLVFAACSQIRDATAPPAPGSPGRTQIEALLSRVTVVDARKHVPGYERGCKATQGCVFGQAWTDDSSAPGGHDGCDTRNNVLARQLTDVRFRPGTRDCVVISGQLADPYSGKTIAFTKQDASAVQIDHVYPLAAAWDMGASTWPLEKRKQFANDLEYNLLAVDGPLNQSKSDKTPANWLPPQRAYQCFYVGKYLTDAVYYQLPISRADRDVIAGVAKRC